MSSIAIINTDPEVDIQKYILSKLEGQADVRVFIGDGGEYKLLPSSVNTVKIPSECDNPAKVKNFVSTWHKQNGIHGYLHMIEDHVEVLKDPSEYITKIEALMTVCDVPTYFSCVTDPCNYVYGRYNPRLSVDIDTEEFKKFGLTKVLFTSHSNTAWTVFNLDSPDFAKAKYDETFSIAMYYIIKFLAERRNNAPKDSLCMMNMYITIPEEYGVFRNNTEAHPLPPTKPEDLQREDALFKEMKVDSHPDNNIDEVLTRLYLKLNSKAA